ncbi:undecaprenyl-diphosphatase [Breoghania corrubedonensis]|uniref:Undecaprenyl-diphosphatase n=1 Tax=Breoghania corrubedonensis TaxID=665038 RepID=A0A2T5VF10_9HYPH|nr:phosphatase PAP2 family protein [Breoghania corrubedonensis]PTW62344.1 undecaprenyl-diphosphatase [Breoghania corrubedonensis]
MQRLSDFAKTIRQDRQSLLAVVLVAVLAFSGWVFLNIADEMSEGELDHIDHVLFLSLREPGNPQQLLGPPWLEETAVEITALGGFPVIILLTVMVSGGLLAARMPGTSAFVVLSIASGAALSTGLKMLYERPRPDIVKHLDVIHTASFPSGHATISTLTYLTLAALIARVVTRRRLRVYLMACALSLAVIIGLSRIYLGVHWPSDVAAGWALGTAWAALSFIVLTGLRLVRRRREGRWPHAGSPRPDEPG